MERLIILSLLLSSSAQAGLLTPVGIFTKSPGGPERNQFSNNERISLSVRVSNATASANRIAFTFRVTNPAGQQVFLHAGNSVPGSVGNSASQVSGVPVSQFFTGPGIYTFTADAVLDGQTVAQSAQFTVSSPNIILIYPPNGARGVADKPLALRWVSSGAAKYRVTVGDSASFFKSVFAQETAGGENFLAYPESPTDPLAKLSSDLVYYWKVEGLDAGGNVVARSELPYNFTAQTASLTRDLAVSAIEATGIVGLEVFFSVRVANQGGTSEANVPLRMSLGGLPAAGSPLTLPQIQPGSASEFRFNAAIPTDQAQSLAIACVEFFDDNVPNNCKSLQVQRPAAAGTGTGFGPAQPLSKDELWQALSLKLKELGYDLDGYEAWEISQLSADDMAALIAEMSKGQVQVSVDTLPGSDILTVEPPPYEVGGGFGAPEDLPAAGGEGPAYDPSETQTTQAWEQEETAPSGSDSGLDLPSPFDEAEEKAAKEKEEKDKKDKKEKKEKKGGGSGEQFWGAIDEKLRGSGVDIREYDISQISEQLSAEDQEAFFEQLAGGEVGISLSGPLPGPEPGVEFGGGGGGADTGLAEEVPQFSTDPLVFEEPVEEPAEVKEADPKAKEPAAATKPAVRASARGFAGKVVENFGARGYTGVVRDAKAFAGLWPRLSSGKAPEIDFEKDMVVVVVAGGKKGASALEFERVAEEPGGLVVQYRLSGAGKAGPRAAAPFAAVVVRSSNLKAEFREVEEGR